MAAGSEPPLSRATRVLRQFRLRPISFPPPAAYAVLVCYLLWVLAQCVRLWKAWCGTREVRCQACSQQPPDWMSPILDRCRAEFRLRRVSILYAPRAPGPLTLGVRHPTIILPDGLFEPAAADDLTAAVCHEMAHIRRHDFLLNLIYQLFSLPISFHPVTRLLKRRIDETRELACDEMAAGRLLDAPAYADSLVSIARNMTRLAPAPPLTNLGYTLSVFDANILEERIMRILDQTPRPGARLGRALLVSACGLLAVACLTAASFSLSITPENKAPSQTLDQFSGIWQAAFKNRPAFILKLKRSGDSLEGTLSVPDSLSADDKGNLTEVKGEPHRDEPIVESNVDGEVFSFKVRDTDGDIDAFELKLVGQGVAEFTVLPPPEATGQVALHLSVTRQLDKPRGELAPKPSPTSNKPALAQETIEGTVTGRGENALSAGGPVRGVAGGVIGGVPAGVPGGVTGPIQSVVGGGVSSRIAGAVGGPLPASAGQEESASISGTVFDPSGARVPSAIVSLHNEDLAKLSNASGARTDWGAATDDTGDFSFTGLLPGGYKLEVAKAGFALYQQILPWSMLSSNPRLQVVLEPGRVMETVDVTARVPAALRPGVKKSGPQRIRVGGLVQATKLIEQTKPEYPESARQKGTEGIVLLRAVISQEGKPIGLKVLSSPDPELSKAATDAVTQWRYEPTLLNGEPIEVLTTVAVRFHLEN
jgi:TonB family protein